MPEESATLRPAVFFDRDNTLMKVGGEYVGDPKDVVLMQGAAEAVAGARHMDFATVVISNQSGVARGFFTEKDVRAVNRRLDEMLRQRDRRAVIDRHEFCPHHPAYGVAPYRQACQCRKPRDGMLRRASGALKLDMERSWLIGDAPRDVEAGRSAGVRTILLKPRDVEPSPAAASESRVAPDFEAASLREALWIIARETGKQLPALSAEESEMAELEEHAPAEEFDPDELSLAEAYEDAIAESRGARGSRGRPQQAELRDAGAGVSRPPAEAAGAASQARDAESPGRADLERPRASADTAGATSPPANDAMMRPAPAIFEVASSAPPTRDRSETGESGAASLKVFGWAVQLAALGLAGWAAYPSLEESRLLLAIFAQLFAMTLFMASRR